MKSILFVCHGNICRSPMAEAILRKKAAIIGIGDALIIDSAGIMAYHKGEAPHRGTKNILHEHGIPCEGLKSRPLIKDDFEDFDFIIAMDGKNLTDIMRKKPKESNPHICLLSDFVNEGWEDVPDPWYTGDFDLVYQLIEKGCQKIITSISLH